MIDLTLTPPSRVFLRAVVYAGFIIASAACGAPSASQSNEAGTTSSAPRHVHRPTHAIRVTANTSFYKTPEAFCQQSMVAVKRAASAISGSSDPQIPDADGVSQVAEGTFVLATGHSTKTCTHTTYGTLFKDWPLTNVTVLGADNRPAKQGFVETNGFSHG